MEFKAAEIVTGCTDAINGLINLNYGLKRETIRNDDAHVLVNKYYSGCEAH